MAHVDPAILDTLAAGTAVSAGAARHVDRCVGCRRAASERGVTSAQLRALGAAAHVRSRGYLLAGIVAASLGAAAVAFPLRGTATSFLAAFEPHRVVALPLTLDDMRSLGSLPDFSAYATTRQLRTPMSANFSDARAAVAAAGFYLRQPAATSGVRVLGYQVNGPTAQLLTFGTRQPGSRFATRPLPPDIAASSLRIDIGATVVATYETAASAADKQRLGTAMRRTASVMQNGNVTTFRVGAPVNTVAPAGASTAMTAHVAVVHNAGYGQARGAAQSYHWSLGTRGGSLPLIVVQMPVPRVATTGVSIARLASFMHSQPGVSPRVAAAFNALGDLSTTLPIPVPIDKAYTQPVVVDGVQGVGLGDDTGIGAAVIWQKNGMLYAVFATQTARNVLAIANTLQ